MWLAGLLQLYRLIARPVVPQQLPLNGGGKRENRIGFAHKGACTQGLGPGDVVGIGEAAGDDCLLLRGDGQDLLIGGQAVQST